MSALYKNLYPKLFQFLGLASEKLLSILLIFLNLTYLLTVLSQVPAFEGDDGFCVFESNAIAYYGNLQWVWEWGDLA